MSDLEILKRIFKINHSFNYLQPKIIFAMKKLTNDQMENLVGTGYCGDLWTIISGGQFQGSDELYIQAVGYFDLYCREYNPQQ